MRKEILGRVLSIQPDSESNKRVTENCGKLNVAWLALEPPDVHSLKSATQKRRNLQRSISKPQRGSEGHKALRTF